ncbi:MAG: hypothetical protein IPM21_13690 [Acidobacteria bacterium]|nr:hypothetical protein [Acidobacteriota bacterium]
MKRLAIGSTAFTLSLGIGLWMAWLFFFANSPLPAKEDQISQSNISEQNFGPDHEYPNESFPFTPEFTNFEMDESASKAAMQMEPIFEGKVEICTADASKEERKWLGLFKRGDDFVLERRTVSYGALTSTDFGSYAPMNFKDSGSAVFLLSDHGSIKQSGVQTLYIKPSEFDGNALYTDGLEIGFRRKFVLGNKTYAVRVAPVLLKKSFPASAVVVEQGTKNQIIWYKTYRDAEGEIGELDWVGDLDSDGLLDVRLSYHRQNGGQLESILFLSSFAHEGKLLGIAASYSARCTEIAPDKIK